MQKTIHIFNLNESSVGRFVLACLLRQKPYILEIEAWLPPVQKLINWLAAYAIRRGWARDGINLTPEFLKVRDRYSEIHFYNMFGHLEDWQNNYYDFKYVDKAIPSYAMAYKNIITKSLLARYLPILMLDRLRSGDVAASITVHGLAKSTLDALNAYRTKKWLGTIHTVGGNIFPIVNSIIAIGVFLRAILWALSRTRPFGFQREEIFLAADYLSDERDSQVYDMAMEGGDVLLVIRQQEKSEREKRLFNRLKTCHQTDGYFSIIDFFRVTGMLVSDSMKLAGRFIKYEPNTFFKLVALPYRRAIIRSLLNRYHTRFYWGRDDYNVEHILRYQELQRVGGCSLGINHGFATYCDRTPAFRHIIFDQYYVFGQACIDVYGDTWSPEMNVTPVGTFGATPEDYIRLKEPRPNDIAIFTGVFIRQQNLVDFIRNIAETFPEKKIWLQLKSNYRDFDFGNKFIQGATSGLDNVIYTEDPIFEIFSRAEYIFSDPSTVTLEAVQFGMASFMIDIGEDHEVCQLRNYPGLCVSSPKDAEKRIKEIEAGTWQYPRESYGRLVDLSGRPFIDVLRQDLGLASRSKDPYTT